MPPFTQIVFSQIGGHVLKPHSRNGKAIARVGGILAVSRAFGDKQLNPYVTCQPEIQTFDVNSPQNKFLIIACDGVWDVITDEEACSLIQSIANPEEAAKVLRDTALTKGSQDNISVIVLRFSSPDNTTTSVGNNPPFNNSKRVLVYLLGVLLLLFFAIIFYLQNS